MLGRGRFPYSGPKSKLQGLTALAPFIGCVFACGAWEMLTNMSRPTGTILLGMIAAGIVGMLAGLILVWMLMYYLAEIEKPKTQIAPSEEGTATDPDLYNVRNNDL